MQADFVVSTRGSDTAPGTPDQPLASCHEALRRVRALRAQGPDRDLVIEVAGGDYFIAEPIRFDAWDSGCRGHRVVLRACEGGRPRLVGGRRLTEWEPVSAGLWRTFLGKGVDVQQLFENGARRRKTRFPDRGYLHTAGIADRQAPDRAFYYAEGDIPEKYDLRHAQVYLWAGYDWFADLSPVAEVDRSTRRILLAASAMVNRIEARPRRRFCLYNIRECLGQPGAFFVDPDEGFLFFAPADGSIEQQEIILPTLTTLLEFRGASEQAPVHDVLVKGLWLDIGAFGSSFCEIRDGREETYWNEPANRCGLVQFENAVDCELQFCEIRNAGYAGVCLNHFAQGNTVHGCRIHQAGYHGVLLAGYNVNHGKYRDHNKRQRIEHNWIHHCGRLVGHGAGIFGHSSGENRIAHNLIHDMPRYGIAFKNFYYSGFKDRVYGDERVTWENHWDFLHARNNTIEFNHVHDVNQDSEDSGIISFIACGTGTVVHANLMRHSPRLPDSGIPARNLCVGLYLDDAADFFTVTDNIIYDLAGNDTECYPILVLAKGIGNVFRNNVLIGDAQTRIGILLMQYDENPTYGHSYSRNLVALARPDAVHFQIRNNVGTWTPEQQIDECDFNLYWAPGGRPVFGLAEGNNLSLAQWIDRTRNKFDTHSVAADPQFRDPVRRDYTPAPGSPALAIGFTPIDISAIGPQDNPFLANNSLPL